MATPTFICTFADVNENRSSSGEPLSHEVLINFLQEPQSHGAKKNMIMRINLFLKATVEWQNNDGSTQKGLKDFLPMIATLLSIVASLLTIICH